MQFVFFEGGAALGNIIYFSFPNHIWKSLHDLCISDAFLAILWLWFQQCSLCWFEAMLPSEELRDFYSALEIKQENMWLALKDIRDM